MDLFSVSKTCLLIDGRNYYREFYRAAKKARSFILIAGWQFDSTVKILRGQDAGAAEGDIEFLSFLNSLSRNNDQLEIYVLAWDFSALFALDREWFQAWTFNWTANSRVYFSFDSNHPVGASHHQKFVIIDGQMAFVGGMDIRSGVWDGRDHRADNPDRIDEEGLPYEPYHDIQSFHIGQVADALTALFIQRWKDSTSEELNLDIPGDIVSFGVEDAIALPAEKVAISRTKAFTIDNNDEWIREIRSLYLDAIDAAEKLIYIENQYFSSQAVYKALMDRMNDTNRSRLQIILITPRAHHSFLEDISIGNAEQKIFHSLMETASRAGHRIGIYHTLAQGSKNGETMSTYIHAKLMIVDDRFITVGSANLSNRSMGLDTELNVAWDAAEENSGEELVRSIRSVRAGLLEEHIGKNVAYDLEGVESQNGLVDFLNGLAGNSESRLRQYDEKEFIKNNKSPENPKPKDFALDPERPVVEENIYELISHDKTGIFAKGIVLLRELLNMRPSTGIEVASRNEKIEEKSE
jgi:phosphatidylserine/phosphatidylglycerophosphate/cardiolipin synthase-like enzyme